MSHRAKGKVAVVGAYPNSLVNFRGRLIGNIVSAGYEVLALSARIDDKALLEKLENIGAKHISYTVERNGMNPLRDLKTLFEFRRIFKSEKPGVVLAYTIKPVIWGGIASSAQSQTRFFALITGLGYAFQGGNWRRNLLVNAVSSLYKLALKGAEKVFFQNNDNLNLFVEKGIVSRDKCYIVNGSGVDTDYFSVADFPDTKTIRFLCIARLLGEKGLREYAEAASIVKEKYPDTEFDLVGGFDPSPDGISETEIKAFEQKGIRYLGKTSDVRPFIANSHVYVLPSYHEGTPRTVLEALAMGRPVITTDAPGCRETVEEGVNGTLVTVRSASKLAEAMITYIQNQELIREQGSAARIVAEEKYDVRKVNARMMQLMGL